MKLIAVKAGARHSATDTELLAQAAEILAELGAPVQGVAVSEITLDALGGRSLQRYIEIIERAVYAMEMNCWLVEAYLDHVVIAENYEEYKLPRYWLIGCRVVGEQVVFLPQTDWLEVKLDWVAKSVGSNHAPVLPLSVKSSDKTTTVGGYALIFGDANKTDLYGDFFTAKTDLWAEQWEKRPMIYHHALDAGTKKAPVVGTWHSIKADDIGVWVEGQIDAAHEYAQAIQTLIKKGVLKLSSDSAPHLVERKAVSKTVSEITRWPMFAVSLTPTPAEPRLMAVGEIKSAYAEAGLTAPKMLIDGDGLQAAPVSKKGNVSMKTAKEFLEAAKQAVIDGNLTQASTLREQAAALKAIETDLAAEVPAIPPRPPFGDADGGKGSSPSVKFWYVKKFGEPDAGFDQIAREIYGGDYYATAYAKNADFRRFIRTGAYDSRLGRTVMLSHTQIMDAMYAGLSTQEIKATMVEAQDTLGGYLVPEDFRQGIIDRLPALTVVRPRANVLTTSRDTVKITKATGGNARYRNGVRVTWVDETPTAGQSATNSSFGQISLPVNVMMATITVSRDTVEDSASNLEQHISTSVTSASAIDEDEKFLVGLGLGSPLGVLPGTGAPTDSDIATVVSGSSSALAVDGLVNVPYALPSQYRQSGAVWVFNKSTAGAIAQMKDGSNRLMWASNEAQLSSARNNRLLGYEVIESEALPDVAANKYVAIFGDFGGYTIADRIGMSLERYLDSATADLNVVKFIARRRLGGMPVEGYRFVVHKIAAS